MQRKRRGVYKSSSQVYTKYLSQIHFCAVLKNLMVKYTVCDNIYIKFYIFANSMFIPYLTRTPHAGANARL